MTTVNSTQSNNETELLINTEFSDNMEGTSEMENLIGTGLETELLEVFVTLLSDTNGSRPINIAPLQENLQGITLTVLNIPGYAQAEPAQVPVPSLPVSPARYR